MLQLKKTLLPQPSDLKAAEKKRQKQDFLQNAYEINIFKIVSPLNYVKLRQQVLNRFKPLWHFPQQHSSRVNTYV